MDYFALHLDEVTENRCRSKWTFRLLERLQRISPFLLVCDPPLGRWSVESQLTKRRGFPEAQWLTIGIELDFVKTILKLLQTELDWPNCNFIPEDPLQLVMIARSADDRYYLLEELRAGYGLPCDDEIWKESSHSNVTLEALVRLLAERRNGVSTPVTSATRDSDGASES